MTRWLAWWCLSLGAVIGVSGASGVPYWQFPRNGTRWESLHAVQGFVEMFGITGESRYRDAAIHLWRGLREYDHHPPGAFSTAGSAHGSIFDPGFIETCGFMLSAPEGANA
ncbi:MAG TPA: hypothetical protein PK379_12815 [Candidatus Hydrogenedentes bacterium]|nr:hypothetical protein [Candidatus Hydrogenedentota bacterium]